MASARAAPVKTRISFRTWRRNLKKSHPLKRPAGRHDGEWGQNCLANSGPDHELRRAGLGGGARPANRRIGGIPENRFVFVWRWLVLLNAGIAIDIWNTTQGWKITISHELSFGDIGSHSIAVYGIIICALRLGAVSALLRVYARATQSRSLSWIARVPDLWGLPAQTGSIGAKLDKAIVLLVALGVASGALLHFVNKTLAGTVYVDGQSFAGDAVEHLTRFMPLGEAWRLGNNRRAHGAQFETPATGMTYYPFWESWASLLVVIVSVRFAAVSLGAIFRRRRSAMRQC